MHCDVAWNDRGIPLIFAITVVEYGIGTFLKIRSKSIPHHSSIENAQKHMNYLT